jgi:hypothetical protein
LAASGPDLVEGSKSSDERGDRKLASFQITVANRIITTYLSVRLLVISGFRNTVRATVPAHVQDLVSCKPGIGESDLGDTYRG